LAGGDVGSAVDAAAAGAGVGAGAASTRAFWTGGVTIGAGVRPAVVSRAPALAGAGEGVGEATRAALRDCGEPADEVLSEGRRTGAVRGRADVGAAVTSAGRVTVPLRVKFWSSLGPMVSVAGVLLAGGGADVCAAWASAAAGESHSPAVEAAIAKRQAPFIPSPLLVLSRAIFPLRGRHMPARSSLFKHRLDEPPRNPRP